jgi:hypothetical protein
MAAYGLADVAIPVGDGSSPGSPVWIWLETTGDVDDIRCRFSGGSRWDVQAKRTCNWDARFASVVDQWVAAVRAGELSDHDRLLLVSGRLSGRLKALADALGRLREEPNGTLLPREAAAFGNFRVQAEEEGWLDVLDEVVRRATIVELAAATTKDAAFREASAMLDGVVVVRGSGLPAVNSLGRFFQTEAARAGSSGVEEWLQVLDQAKIVPGHASSYALAGGARAIAAYRDRLAARQDLLEVDHLAVGVPPMPVDDLLDTFRVQLPASVEASSTIGSSLAHLGRRWRRFVIVGLPGSGKSTAFEQLAAAWSRDLDAPLPILIRVHQLVPFLRTRRHLQLEDWCRLGDSVTDDIVPHLADRLRAGSAALLLDGLDECRDQVGPAASAISSLAGMLDARTGILVSTREVTAQVSKMTGLPMVVLEEPQHLDYRIADLVEHVMRSDGDSTSDIAGRRKWVGESQKAHPDVWSIPLFAVLLAVHAARAPSSELPSSRAEAVVAAVADSVDRWERQKVHEPGGWDPTLHPRMILDGFATIGHELIMERTDVGSCTKAVALHLADEWGLAPATSAAAAHDVVQWWTERVGAFVKEDDNLRPRLRLLGEVGDAMWALRQTSDGRVSWLQRIVDDPSRYREPALLASALDDDVAEELIDAADGPGALVLAADSVLEGASPPDDALGRLVKHLILLSTDPSSTGDQREPNHERAADKMLAHINERQENRDGPGWRFMFRLASLPLPVNLRAMRDCAFDDISDLERRTVARALAITADCAIDEREPSGDERGALEAVLNLPVPDREVVTRYRSRRHLSMETGDPVLTGRAGAALGAIRYVGLEKRTAQAAASLGSQVWYRDGERLFAALSAAGFTDEVREASRSEEFAETMKNFLGTDTDRETGFILREATTLGNPGRTRRETWQGWRLDAAAALFELLDPGSHAIGAGPAAVRHTPEEVRHLIRLAVGATGFSPDIVAEECQRALGLFEADPLDTAVLFYVKSEPQRVTKLGTPLIGPGNLDHLRACLASPNPWLFWTAAKWIVAQEGDEIPDILWEVLPEMSSEHRGAMGRWLLEVSDRSDLTAEWLAGRDFVLRAAAARVVGKTASDHVAVAALAQHNDLEVRLEVLRGLSQSSNYDLLAQALELAGGDGPTEWTCGWCGSLESVTEWDCTHCPRGARSDLEEEIDRIIKKSDQPT